jgi:ABC-type polysaccharide/polyol phosphate export permease
VDAVIHSIRELWEYRYLIWNLAQRDLRSRYKKSVLGWLWSLLNPASTLVIYTVVFGTLLGSPAPPMGDRPGVFGLYLFAGLVVWNFFNLVMTGSISAMSSSGQLLKKVYFPASAPAIANLLTSLSQVLIEMGILTAFMLLFPLVVVLTGLFALGLGLWASILNLFYRDVGYLVTIALNVWFFATPIIYPMALLGGPQPDGSFRRYYEVGGIRVSTLLRINPVTELVEISRQIFYLSEWPDLRHLAYATTAAVLSVVVGIHMFNRRAQYVSEEV